MSDSNAFYASMAPLYHLVYRDWKASIDNQARMLDSVIREFWGEVSTVLDASCGIGTQALGLAKLGYKVTGSDLSPEAIERARREATERDLRINFSVADMRELYKHHRSQFDIVLACDNAVPHLLTDDDILAAFRAFRACTRPGGGCIISVRDYEKMDLSLSLDQDYGVREEEGGVRWHVWQIWEPDLPHYDVTMHFEKDHGDERKVDHFMRSRYYAVGITRLMELMTEADFIGVCRLDDRFFQPLLVGTRNG